MEKKSFMLYLDWKQQFQLLSNEQAGILIKALLHYAETGEKLQADDGMLVMAFSFMIAQMDRDFEKYSKKCEKNRIIALEREQKKRERISTNVQECEPTYTNRTDTETDTDKDTDIIISGDKSPEPPKKEVKYKFGEYQHVCLTDRQYQKLIADYGEYYIQQYITKLDEYIQMQTDTQNEKRCKILEVKIYRM